VTYAPVGCVLQKDTRPRSRIRKFVPPRDRETAAVQRRQTEMSAGQTLRQSSIAHISTQTCRGKEADHLANQTHSDTRH